MKQTQHPKWILITGATSGIGLTTALALALEGHHVIATGRSSDKLQSVDAVAKSGKVTIRRVIVDVTDDASISQMRSEVLALTNAYGVDVVINNAGYAEGGALEEIPLSRLRRQFDTNVIGLVGVTQAVLPEMRQRKSGTIINVSSVLGKVSLPLMGAYTASKHAVEAISDAMRIELQPVGIHVVTIAPGTIKTNFSDTLTTAIQSWVSSTSPYRSSYQKFTHDRAKDRGAHPNVIAEAILSAVNATAPKARYAVPFDSKLMPVAKALLSTRAADKILRNQIMGKSD